MDNTIRGFINQLSSCITQNRRDKIEAVLKNRTRHVTVVLEDVFQSHNASAVIRSCEIFGIQDVHIIEAAYPFAIKGTVAMGASKWIDLIRFAHINDAVAKLKKDGYCIVATTVHETARPLHELAIENKMALLFGTENTGLSQAALDQSDEFVTIPMFGFTQSFNISVSVAICLYQIIMKLHASTTNWRLTQEERDEILLLWLKKIIRGADTMQDRFFEDKL